MVMYIEDTANRPTPFDPRRERHAFILAGGKGVRLRPYTTLIPKPLVPIGDQSLLEILLCQLASCGFQRATISLGHLGDLIRAYIGDGSRWGISVSYVTEDAPLGTVGPLISALDELPENVVVLNGDILTDIDFDHLLRTHEDSGASLTIATYTREHRVDFGVLGVHDGAVVRFTEKPTYTYDVSMGVYAVRTSMLRDYRPGVPLGFDHLILDRIARDDAPSSYNFPGFWLDIGRPDDFDRANADIELLRPLLMPERRASWLVSCCSAHKASWAPPRGGDWRLTGIRCRRTQRVDRSEVHRRSTARSWNWTWRAHGSGTSARSSTAFARRWSSTAQVERQETSARFVRRTWS